MLEILCLKHDLWVKMARGICKDPFLADDIVSEMYLKLKDYDKELNDFYIYFTLKSVWLDWLKAENKRMHCELSANLAEEEEEQDTIYKVPDCLTWKERKILILRYDNSLREIERRYKINFMTVSRIEKKAKIKANKKP
jgi:RNA polymerase sigma factor (sigma-70 family)